MTRRRAGSTVGALVVTAALGAIPAGNAIAQTPASPGPLERAQADGDAKTFVNDMAVAGMAEVQLGKLAAERGGNAEVKAFGQQMVTDHSKANAELKQVASQMKLQVPAQLDQKHRDLAAKLSKLKGAEFDREYMTAMVQGHQEVAGKLRTRANMQGSNNTVSGSGIGGATPKGTSGVQDEQRLTQWATKTLPVVEQHLQRARDLQQKVAQ